MLERLQGLLKSPEPRGTDDDTPKGAVRLRLIFATCGAQLLLACAAAAPPPADLPPQAATPPAASVPPPGAPTSAPPASPLAALDPSLPPAPEACAAYAAHPVGPCSESPLEQLDAALSADDARSTDATLAALEACAEFPPGWVRGLRAELAPPACADALVAPFFDQRAADAASPPLPDDIQGALVGLALGARLLRLDAGTPPLPEPFTKEQFVRYFQERLEPWVAQRAKAIFQLASEGASLRGYGRGIVAVEAAVADLRFVQMAREVPLPEEMTRDDAVKNEYYAALDMALEPRKTRGRDAALAGLDVFSELGVIGSARIDRARAILSRSYAGHRIDALDGLLLPELPPLQASTAELRVASRLPTFFAQHLFRDRPTAEPALLRALMEQGVFPSLRQKLDGTALHFQSAELYARALLALGQRYWRSKNFERAAAVAGFVPTTEQAEDGERRLLAALATALRGGPEDARAMMLGGPLLPEGVGNVGALDELAKGSDEVAAMAAYDAAYVLALLPPTEDVRRFWQGIAERYERAARLTKNPERQKDAQSRAKAARETARAVRE